MEVLRPRQHFLLLRINRSGGLDRLTKKKISYPGRDKRGFLLQTVQTVSGAHPTSYSVGTEGSFPGVIQLGRDADQSLLRRAEVKNQWNYTFTPPVWLYGMDRDKCILLPFSRDGSALRSCLLLGSRGKEVW